MDRDALRAVALRVAALALLLALTLVAVLTIRTLQRVPDATLYFVRTEATAFTLERAPRRLGTRDVAAYAEAAVAALAAGPTASEAEAGLWSAVPEGTRVLSAVLRDGVLAVDLSADVASGGGSSSMLGRLEQLRWTLARPASVDAVELAVEGRPLRVLGGEGILVDPRWSPPADGRLPRW